MGESVSGGLEWGHVHCPFGLCDPGFEVTTMLWHQMTGVLAGTFSMIHISTSLVRPSSNCCGLSEVVVGVNVHFLPVSQLWLDDDMELFGGDVACKVHPFATF